MNQALILVIFLSLFSFLSAIQCSPNLKVVCSSSLNVGSCRCVAKRTIGNFALTHTCTFPLRPTCFKNGNGKSIACICQ